MFLALCEDVELAKSLHLTHNFPFFVIFCTFFNFAAQEKAVTCSSEKGEMAVTASQPVAKTVFFNVENGEEGAEKTPSTTQIIKVINTLAILFIVIPKLTNFRTTNSLGHLYIVRLPLDHTAATLIKQIISRQGAASSFYRVSNGRGGSKKNASHSNFNNTWTHKFCVIPYKDHKHVPSLQEKDTWRTAGLGGKTVIFTDKNGGHQNILFTNNTVGCECRRKESNTQ